MLTIIAKVSSGRNSDWPLIFRARSRRCWPKRPSAVEHPQNCSGADKG